MVSSQTHKATTWYTFPCVLCSWTIPKERGDTLVLWGLWGLRLGLGWLLRSMVIQLPYLDLSLWVLSDHLTVSIRFE